MIILFRACPGLVEDLGDTIGTAISVVAHQFSKNLRETNSNLKMLHTLFYPRKDSIYYCVALFGLKVPSRCSDA